MALAKGRIGRAIRYDRDNFFSAIQFNDLDDLNAQADCWCQGQSADRLCPEDKDGASHCNLQVTVTLCND